MVDMTIDCNSLSFSQKLKNMDIKSDIFKELTEEEILDYIKKYMIINVAVEGDVLKVNIDLDEEWY